MCEVIGLYWMVHSSVINLKVLLKVSLVRCVVLAVPAITLS